MGSNPSLLFVNQHYWPDVASTGQHLTDLAEHLAAAGFDVRVLCGRGAYRSGTLDAPAREIHDGVRIERVAIPGFGRGGLAGRTADYAAFHLRAGVKLARAPRPDLVVSLTTPSLLPTTVEAVCGRRGVPYGIWAMDLHPEIEDALGFLPGGRVVSGLLGAASRRGYRGADFVVTLGPHMARTIRDRKEVEAGRIHEIPVWNDADEVRPVPPSRNRLRRELGFTPDDFVVLYSGNAGYAHCFEEVLAAMRRMNGRGGIEFVFVGGGPRRARIEARAAEARISNFRYLDYFPREQLHRSLSVGDVHLLTLAPEMAGLAAPGKLYAAMAAGRPVVMVGPRASEPARTIRDESIGFVIDPEGEGAGGADALVECLERLRADPALRGRLGSRARRAFLEGYEREHCCERWAGLIHERLADPA